MEEEAKQANEKVLQQQSKIENLKKTLIEKKEEFENTLSTYDETRDELKRAHFKAKALEKKLT